jgi:hypothetical protein
VKRLLSFSFLAMLLLPAVCLAWDLNKDFYNNTGQLVNDIEIILDGSPTVTEHYDGDDGGIFPNFQAYSETINGATRTILRWSGLSVLPGQKVHVGYSAGGVRCIGMRWTYNGVPVGPVWQGDIQPRLGGIGIEFTNTLVYSLWPVSWPVDPPGYYITKVEVFYFPALLPLPSLNYAALPTWTPIRRNVLWPASPKPSAPLETQSGMYVGPGASTTFTDPNPALSAVSAVWVVELNTAPTGGGGSTDFVQFNLLGGTPVPPSTWGRLRELFR